MKSMRIIYYVVFLVSAFVLAGLFPACSGTDTPKPRGYFRIDLPEKQYRIFDSIYPFKAEIPVYARVMKDLNSPGEPNWININFPLFRAKVHISYKAVHSNVFEYIEDTRALALKHIPKADAIHQSAVNYPEKQVYGGIFDIAGSNAASTYQFYLTDSTRHFIRGALYFSATPNNDSLAPVLAFIRKDIDRFIQSFEWKQ